MKNLSLFVILLLALLVVALPANAGGDKVDVCHYDADTGTYHLINVSDNAFLAHEDHGDASPGNPVPGMEDEYDFAEDCSLIASNSCPADSSSIASTVGVTPGSRWILNVNGINALNDEFGYGYIVQGTAITWADFLGDGCFYFGLCASFETGDLLEFERQDTVGQFACIVP